MTIGIYMIENKINNKIYIGQSKNIEKRLKEHIKKLNRNIHENEHLNKSWLKYGEFSFNFKIIEECDIEGIDEREIHYINFYNTIDKKYGYNLKVGGIKPFFSQEIKDKR